MVKKVLSKKAIDALFSEACGHWNNGDVQTAFRLFAQLAKAGHADSQLTLANFYDEGLGVEKNPQKELYWLYRAADQENSIAAHNIGAIYWQQKKYAQAIAWLALAGQGSEYGDGDALCEAGEVLLRDVGDIECAKKYFLLAKKSTLICKASLRKAEKLLGIIYSSKRPANRMVRKIFSKRADDPLFSKMARYWYKRDFQSAYPLLAELDKKYRPVEGKIGLICLQQKKYTQAIAWLVSASYGAYGVGDALCDAGEILLKQFGDMKCAKQYLLFAKEFSFIDKNKLKRAEKLLQAIRSPRKLSVELNTDE